MPKLWGNKYTKNELLKHVGDLSQLAFVRPFELSEGSERGCRGVTIVNAAGLELSVLTDRGMSIYDARYHGTPLALKSPAGPVHPAYYSQHGLDWLRSWPAGFLTPCGLSNVGSPCSDNGVEYGLHGRIAAAPAKNVTSGGRWTNNGTYELFVSGSMRESAVFSENLVLTRKITVRIDEPIVNIEDTIENQGFDPAPLMFLQHVNLGFPLVDKTARLLLPKRNSVPRDRDAEPGVKTCCSFHAPLPGYAEQVFYHDCDTDPRGQITAALINDSFDNGTGLGVYLRFAKKEYPILAEWKMMREGVYVVGLEPSNCHVQGRVNEKEFGTLRMIQPGKIKKFNLEIGFMYGKKQLKGHKR